MIFAGIGTAVGAMAAMDFDFSKLTAGSFAEKTSAVDGAFHSISVNGEECDVRLYPSESGDIHIYAAAPDSLLARSGSGEITVEKVNAEAYILVKTKSGDIELSDARSKAVEIAAGSGDISLLHVIAEDNIRAESGSGDIKLKNSDAKELWIKSRSGDVYGTLLTDKVFLTDTASGSVSVPKSAGGGRCEIITASGDIDFTIGEEK